MNRLPQVTAREVIAALKRAGFVVRRIKGSHHFMRHSVDPTRETVVALHSGDLPQGTLRDILKQAQISPAEFRELL
jgi:predicted RNA binding protein YcfA (HicA-like mRNA interferase family)